MTIHGTPKESQKSDSIQAGTQPTNLQDCTTIGFASIILGKLPVAEGINDKVWSRRHAGEGSRVNKTVVVASSYCKQQLEHSHCASDEMMDGIESIG